MIKAKASFVRGSPRKLRLIADGVRGLPAQRAIDILKVLPQEAARQLLTVMQQAMGNAKNNAKVSPEGLIIDNLQVGEGPRFKRRDKSHGARFDSGMKRKKMAHITVQLKEAKNGA